jgi:hypothetical protein
MGIANPELLSDHKWAEAFQDYLFVEERESKKLEQIFTNALSKVLSAAFGNGE